MNSKYLITGLLAVAFCISGHFAMAAYTDYRISKARLDLLRSQERSVKRQITELEKKIEQINQVNAFVSKANQLGLDKKKWDQFYVDIKKTALTFSELETILGQTTNSAYFYYKPKHLLIQAGAPAGSAADQPQTTSPETQTDKVSQLAESIQSATIDENNQAQAKKTDVIINIDGKFIARHPEIR